MLTELKIGNFKAFGPTQRIPIKPLTLIFGANSSGKSSIIHALLLANHALETGDWNVRGPRLATESVDLGGFPHFVHMHQPQGAFSLHFETDVSKDGWMDYLVGTEEEKQAFRDVRRFGLSFSVARRSSVDAPTTQDSAVAIQMAEVAYDGHTALEFICSGPDRFQCVQVHAEHLLIRRLLQRMTEFAKRADEEDESCRRRALSELQDSPPGPDGLGREANNISEAMALREEGIPPPGSSPHVREAATLLDKLVAALAKRQFRLRGDYLADEGPDGDWSYPHWDTDLEDGEEGGPYGFFRRHFDDDKESAVAQAIRYNLTRMIAALTKLTSQELRRLSYLGPQRIVPPRHLLALAPGSSASPGTGLEAWRHLCLDVQAQDALNRWFGPEWLGLPYRLRVRPLQYGDEPAGETGLADVVFEDTNVGTRLSHRDLGFGITQALPVLVHAAALSKRIIAVEQPELHLHPAMQAELGDVFIESALGPNRNTFLLETHSEHLILRIMRRIRETTQGRLPAGAVPITPKDVSVVFVEPGPEGSMVREMPLNSRGELVKSWPGGFFEEGFREIFA